MLPKTGTCAPFEQHPNQFSHAAPATVPPCSRQYLLRNQPLGNEGFSSSVECGDATHCGRVRGRDEEAPLQQQLKGLSPTPAQPYLRPLGLRLRKSASLLEWLNKKLSEQGEACSVESDRFHPIPQSWGFRGGAQDEVTLQADPQLSGSKSSQDTWQGLRAAASSCNSDEGLLWRASLDSTRSVSLDPLPLRRSPDFLTASSGASIQVSQSELDLEKFAASILLDEGPLPAGENLGQARASDSSLQGSNGEWEAMLVDNLSVATSITGSAPEHGSASGALAQQAAAVHPQAGVELPGSTQPFFPMTESCEPFRECLGASAFQAAAGRLTLGTGFPSSLDEPMLGTGQFKQAGSASTLQSSMTGTAFGSEPATPTGMSGKGQRLLRTVSSSFPAGAAVVASPSAPQRQRACRSSLDVLRSASCGITKLVASTRNVTLKEVPASELLSDTFIGAIK